MVILTPSVKLVSVTPDAEKTMAYVARVSNPKNQDNPNYARLLQYCIEHEHWSVFEQAYMTLEIETSLAIATQILRHRSFTFQQFSQRYADTSLLSMEIPIPDLRRQDTKNRQNSIDDLDQETKLRLQTQVSAHFHHAKVLYDTLLKNGVAKECARAVLPQNTMTRLYMTGSVRSWIHYISLREKNGTQQEHMDVANLCKCIFICQFPSVAEALGWVRHKDCPECQDAHSITIE